MTSNWTPPGGQPPGPPGVPPGPAQPQQPGYAYVNWGLQPPPTGPQYPPVHLVPRPPRPGVLNLALALTILGVVVSALNQVFGAIGTIAARDQVVSDATNRFTNDPNAPDMSGLIRASTTVGLVVGAVFWLIPAAGAIVTAVLARRGYNAARIVLACLMGLYALVGLCGGVFSVARVGGGVATSGWTVASGVLDLVLGLLAVAIGVLVLMPAANRYLSAGPGRRFAPVEAFPSGTWGPSGGPGGTWPGAT
ncbi:MAG TPA: hypothetical protein VJT31_04560 [Rugosimonospora sp.]|nr:hypothetical protein [Rugosimonospora sp.]